MSATAAIYARNIIPGDYQAGAGALLSLEQHGEFFLLLYQSAKRMALLAWWPAVLRTTAIEDAVSVAQQLIAASVGAPVPAGADTLDALITPLAVQNAATFGSVLSQEITAKAAAAVAAAQTIPQPL